MPRPKVYFLAAWPVNFVIALFGKLQKYLPILLHLFLVFLLNTPGEAAGVNGGYYEKYR